MLRAPRGSDRPRARVGGPLIVTHLARRVGDPAGASVCPRVGFAVSRAVGNAVVRNRVQRRLRALMSTRLRVLAPDTDVVIRALPASAGATSAELGAALDHALGRATRRAPALAAARPEPEAAR